MIVKTGCKAALYLKLNSSTNKWVITEFIDEHNHQLLPEYVHKISCFRQLKEWAKKQLELNDSSGVSVVANINAMTQMGGGPEHCGFTERDCRNNLAKLRRDNFRKGDAAALMQQFRLKKQKDPNFYYSYKFDTENRLEIVFWADSVSRSWYRYFGVVVTFDATYIVNRYDLPVAPFVGVNHHGFSIIFGCAMMTHESAESYKWIINCFLECMGGKAPESIITDQSLSMKKAIEETLPDTTHRHCTWHILNKVNPKIGNNELAVVSALLDVIHREVQCKKSWVLINPLQLAVLSRRDIDEISKFCNHVLCPEFMDNDIIVLFSNFAEVFWWMTYINLRDNTAEAYCAGVARNIIEQQVHKEVSLLRSFISWRVDHDKYLGMEIKWNNEGYIHSFPLENSLQKFRFLVCKVVGKPLPLGRIEVDADYYVLGYHLLKDMANSVKNLVK
ncbi:Protein FAR1-RELATED SEQUENCE 5 [Rhynchospora pubera]|uniref:Protein FAR1-RELATED SEQUENCE 5 n=1 Tax=Rhynchospora pubera TaxID=906938 RepID=A0AAV8H1W7_9POAL|nr:Protein FAR1-RELATED SEQUENCE 5 [Rhynchospora pubera]